MGATGKGACFGDLTSPATEAAGPGAGTRERGSGENTQSVAAVPGARALPWGVWGRQSRHRVPGGLPWRSGVWGQGAGASPLPSEGPVLKEGELVTFGPPSW